eukprot:1421232-Prymnesium_polylepis.1
MPWRQCRGDGGWARRMRRSSLPLSPSLSLSLARSLPHRRPYPHPLLLLRLPLRPCRPCAAPQRVAEAAVARIAGDRRPTVARADHAALAALAAAACVE